LQFSAKKASTQPGESRVAGAGAGAEEEAGGWDVSIMCEISFTLNDITSFWESFRHPRPELSTLLSRSLHQVLLSRDALESSGELSLKS